MNQPPLTHFITLSHTLPLRSGRASCLNAKLTLCSTAMEPRRRLHHTKTKGLKKRDRLQQTTVYIYVVVITRIKTILPARYSAMPEATYKEVLYLFFNICFYRLMHHQHTDGTAAQRDTALSQHI